ncbi:MAG: ABC transporter permease [Cyclobacteriaceae bacterium]
MLANYLVTALRFFMRQRAYTAINIFGLTVGITSALLLILYIADELSYDRQHGDAARIYRSIMQAKLQDREINTVFTGFPMADALQKDVPAVESTVRVTKWSTIPIRFDDKVFTERRFLLADSNFFTFFNFPLVAGNPQTALVGPDKIVITESTARKYFGYKGPGDLSPLGKIFFIGSNGENKAEVTGIAADVPHNSHLQFDFVLSLQTFVLSIQANTRFGTDFWLNSSVITYFKILPEANIGSVDQQYDYFINTYIAKEIRDFFQMDLKQFGAGGSYVRYVSQPLLNIHLHSQLPDELEPNGNIRYLYLFGLIAGFIILLACINFMNLSTARAASRAKEVGIRKTIGAFRSKLIGQFLMESYLYTILAVVLSLMFVSLALTSFNEITAKSIQFGAILTPSFLGGLAAFIVIIGLVAGSYPAFYLTSFQPVEVLKGKVRAGIKSSGIRNALVVFQFFISIALAIATLMVFQQLRYVQQQNLGFNKENVMGMMHTLKLGNAAGAFKNELKQLPFVTNASFANRLPPDIDWNSTFRLVDAQQEHLLSIYVVDHDALETMGYELVAGRFFSRDIKADTAHVLINEAAMRQFGWETFEGKKLFSRFNTLEGNNVEVIGVLKNFNFESLKNTIRPMVVFLGPEPNFEMAVRLTGGDVREQVASIGQVWKKYAPDAPFEYSFLNDNFNATYRAEERMGLVFTIFTGLAIAIACLGLFGLATFAAEQRAKEISIRKVMGASVAQLVVLMTKDFTQLILIALVLAIPVTWYALEKWWLATFAFRTSYSFALAGGAGLLALAMALFTISFQSIKVAIANPALRLRSE